MARYCAVGSVLTVSNPSRLASGRKRRKIRAGPSLSSNDRADLSRDLLDSALGPSRIFRLRKASGREPRRRSSCVSPTSTQNTKHFSPNERTPCVTRQRLRKLRSGASSRVASWASRSVVKCRSPVATSPTSSLRPLASSSKSTAPLTSPVPGPMPAATAHSFGSAIGFSASKPAWFCPSRRLPSPASEQRSPARSCKRARAAHLSVLRATHGYRVDTEPGPELRCEVATWPVRPTVGHVAASVPREPHPAEHEFGGGRRAKRDG